MPYCLGRKPRTYNPGVPHYSALLRPDLSPVPASVDNTSGITDWTVMGNDKIGDCTIAAIYHARQVWSAAVCGKPDTQPEEQVLSTYSAICGYVPGDPSTDNGGIEQDVLAYWIKNGIPLANGCRDDLAAMVEVDHRNLDDVKRTIWECGVAYIGIAVPHSVMAEWPAPAVWQLVPGDYSDGGHAVILTGYGDGKFKLVSWGQNFEMTEDCFSAITDEVYALASPDWIEATGRTLLGLTMPELEVQMQYLKAA
jgi:hypothetical protein